MKKLSNVNIHSGNTITSASGVKVVMSGGNSAGACSSGTYLIDTDPSGYPEIYETLEINWVKVKKTIGETEYNKVIRDAVKQWLKGDYSDRTMSLLKHEGLIDTKRENSLNNLLEEDDSEDD